MLLTAVSPVSLLTLLQLPKPAVGQQRLSQGRNAEPAHARSRPQELCIGKVSLAKPCT